MSLAITDLARAREAAAVLLEELRLEAHLFCVEPKDDEWELQVECATDGGWETTTVPIAKDSLLVSLDDRETCQRLLVDLRGKLAACKIRKS